MAGADSIPQDEKPTRRVDPDDRPTVGGLGEGQAVLGRFRLQRLLGQGGMGVVWLARDQSLGDEVALKFVSELLKRDAAAVDELKSETRKARQLTHPHIVRIHEFWEDAQAAAVSMEFVDGRNLSQLRLEQAGKVFDPGTLAPWVGQLCAALDYAHQKARLVHRDLKPANLMIDARGDLKVADFGISAAISETTTRVSKRVSSGFTETYASPQQLRGKRPTPADDIYSLGATLYELLTGKPPFYRGNVVLQVEEEAPAPLTERRAELGNSGSPIPKNWEETILACLAKEAKDRPQSAGEVAGRLGLTNDSTDKGTDRDRVVAKFPSSPRKSKLPLYVGFAAAVALAVAAVLLWPKAERKPVGPALVAGPREPSSAGQDGLPTSGSPTSTAAVLAREFTVTVDPADAAARVWLGPLSDVAVTGGQAVLKDLPDGEQELIVQAAGYQPYTTRVVVKDGRGGADARLVPVRGSVEIAARPGTVVTALDVRGKATRLGTVPAGGTLTSENLLTIGAYTLRFEHPDLAPTEQPGVELVIGRTIKAAPVQTPLPGELRIFSVPSGAEVRVNGTVAGTTPATLKGQPSEQPLNIAVFQRGYRRAEQSVTLKPKEVRTVNLGTLTAESGGINFRFSNPDFRLDQARLTIDGKEITGAAATSPRNATLALDGLEVGPLAIALTHPDYQPWSQTVTVRDQQTTTVDVKLQPKPGRLSLRVAGPTDVTFFVNGQPVGLPLAGGPYVLPAQQELALEIKASGWKSATRRLTLPANGAETWSASMEKLRGPEPGQPWTIPELGLVMQSIAPGIFMMGSTNGDGDEKPQTQVMLTQPFWLGKTEVTQREWEDVMGGNPSHFKGNDWPVEQVSWNEAMEFCRKLTERERTAGRIPEGYAYTLPTEAQWEYACRAGTTGDYAGSLAAMGWYDQNSGNQTHPVGQKQANAWGLADMHGNVWEWCADWYGNYPGGSVTDPTGATSGTSRSLRVNRGGSWDYYVTYCRSANRNWNEPGYRRLGLGFRLALSSVP